MNSADQFYSKKKTNQNEIYTVSKFFPECFVSLVEKSFFYCHLFDVKYVVDAVFAQNKSRISDKWVFRDIFKVVYILLL